MPNWCLNKLTITGPEADVRSFKAESGWTLPLGKAGGTSWTRSTSTAWFLFLMKS